MQIYPNEHVHAIIYARRVNVALSDKVTFQNGINPMPFSPVNLSWAGPTVLPAALLFVEITISAYWKCHISNHALSFP